MSWAAQFRLGPDGKETILDAAVATVSVETREIEQSVRIISGDLKRSILKMNVPQIKISGNKMSLTQYNRLLAYRTRGAFLVFKSQRNWEMPNVEATTDSTGAQVVVPNASDRGLKIVGVFAATDETHTGTNHFDIASTFTEATRQILFLNPIFAAFTPVLIDYTFTKYLVKITSFTAAPMRGSARDRWAYQLNLEGV